MDKSIKSTDPKEFKPTPHMEKWLYTALQTGEDVIDRLSEISGIDESTYYAWRKDPAFIEWFDTEYNKGLRASRWRLNAIGMKNAKRDHKYWQDMQRITGNLKDDKATVAVQVNNDLSGIEFVTDERI